VAGCVSIEHLFLGTNADNMEDKVAKGRQMKGQACHLAKLTPEIVRLLRQRHASGVSQKQIAIEHGVSSSRVSSIVNRLSWKHVE
jgi:predicted XRE-type DNA-binding protein